MKKGKDGKDSGNSYEKQCMELSKLYKESGKTGRKFVYNNKDDDIISMDSPNISSDLQFWSLEEKSDVDKYIDLGLDMEFTNHDSFSNIERTTAGKLTKIDKKAKGAIFSRDNVHKHYRCRLRENVIHWWDRKAENPIPESCMFRVYAQDNEWSMWIDSSESDIYDWDKNNNSILSFEIKYG